MNDKTYQHDSRSSVLLNTFQIDKKSYRVFYNNETLIWERVKPNKGKVSIPIHDVVSVCYPKRKSAHSSPPITPSLTSPQHVHPALTDASNDDNRSLTINYAKRNIDPKVQDSDSGKKCRSRDRNVWRIHSITLHSNEKYIVREWHDTLNRILDSLKRPRKLLLFINPYGGKKNALQLYEKYAKPIFRLANVDVSVIISQRPNQIFDLVMQQQLDQYDGVVCSGGDGTFSELFNGLIYRKMLAEHSSGGDELNLDVESIPSPDIPCGIIPAGSTDTIAYCLHGTTDIKTCIIHIVLGQVSGFDISSISSDKGLIKFYASVVAYGFLGDISFEQENYRHLGPRRYEYVGFKKVVLNRGYDVEVLIHQEKTQSAQGQARDDDCDKIKCCENCSVCSAPGAASATTTEGEEERYKRITGRFFMINLANISCACERSPAGMSPYCHLADGYNHIILVRHGSMLQNLRFLLKLSSKKGQIEDFPFVELYKTKKVYFKALNSTSEGSLTDSTQPISSLGANKYTSVWNCDGEIVQDTDVVIRAHRKLLPVFYRGPAPEDVEKNSKSCCCC